MTLLKNSNDIIALWPYSMKDKKSEDDSENQIGNGGTPANKINNNGKPDKDSSGKSGNDSGKINKNNPNNNANNNNIALWKSCLTNNTTEKREGYCNSRFNIEYKKNTMQI